eukprot:gene31347-6503_t
MRRSWRETRVQRMLHAHQAANSHHPQTSPTSGGWRAGRSLNGSVQVEPPFTFAQQGKQQKSLQVCFAWWNHKDSCRQTGPSVPRLRKYCGAELLPQCTRNGKTDFRALRDAFNQRFAQLFQPGAPDVPDDKMLYSKSVTHLRSYFNTQHHAFRANDSHRFNRGVAAMPGAASVALSQRLNQPSLPLSVSTLALSLEASQPDLASTAAQPALEIGLPSIALSSKAPQLGLALEMPSIAFSQQLPSGP